MSVGKSSHRQLREKDSSCGGFKEERRENLRSEAAVYKLDLFFSPLQISFTLMWNLKATGKRDWITQGSG